MTDDEKEHMESVAHVLGKTHGAIFMLLNKPTTVPLRVGLQEVFDSLNDDIIKLYFSNPR